MNKRKLTYISLFLTVVIGSSTYLSLCFFSYKTSLKNFKENISAGKYSEAEAILSKNSLNIISKLKLNDSLSQYLNNYLGELNDEYLSGKLSQDSLLIKLTSLEKFNISNSEILAMKNNLPLIANSKENYSKALALFKENKYSTALEYFNKITPLDNNYIECLTYKEECINVLKGELLTQVDELVYSKEYSKGIDLIESNLEPLNHNIELLNKLEELEQLRHDYLVQYSKNNINTSTSASASVSAYYNKLSTDTINTFDITSNTNHLVFVNISEQKTYIYEGSKNKWNLEKEFPCSTGIEGEETPVGVFSVQTRAPWFFSPQYGQGGKYYVQFMGNYLFHSVPFAEDKETIVDDTLGKPASHGCIRLAVDDSKWLYDNVTDGSKVIIY